MIVTTKEQVFRIMGKYYGNAHYREAIRLADSEEDLILMTQLLDEINTLGYYFSNIGRLTDTEDVRFAPLLLDYFDRFKAIHFKTWVISLIRFKSYDRFVPQLLEVYKSTDDIDIQQSVSQCIFQISSRKYINEYLRIVCQPAYGLEHDFLMDVLCKLRVREVLPKLLSLVDSYPKKWRWTFLYYIHRFKDPSVLPYIERFIDADDSEIRAMAKKAIIKIK